ncbi:MAG: hypothetical protein K8R21_10465, partial [Leptospira sp.]|nr:hypothetical protein [Leptospira sp.]
NLFIDYLKKESGSRKYSVLAAIPSPDSKYTALFYSFGSILQPSEEISLAIFSSMDWKATNLTTFKGHYFSTLPPVSWSKDSGKIFILRENDVVEVKPNGKQFVQSNVFPECFVPTESGSSVSESGIEFARIEEEKKIELRRNSSVKFSKVRMVSDFKKIGINCRS